MRICSEDRKTSLSSIHLSPVILLFYRLDKSKMINQSVRVRSSLHDCKENKPSQSRKVTNNIMCYEQSTPIFQCSTVSRSSLKARLPKQPTRSPLGDKLINNFVVPEPEPSSYIRKASIASFIVDDFDDDEANDMSSEGARNQLYNSLSITVDKPKHHSTARKKNVNTTTTTAASA